MCPSEIEKKREKLAELDAIDRDLMHERVRLRLEIRDYDRTEETPSDRDRDWLAGVRDREPRDDG